MDGYSSQGEGPAGARKRRTFSEVPDVGAASAAPPITSHLRPRGARMAVTIDLPLCTSSVVSLAIAGALFGGAGPATPVGSRQSPIACGS